VAGEMWRGPVVAALAVTLLVVGALGGSAHGGVPCGADVINFNPVFSPDSQRVAFLSGGGGGCVPHGALLVAPAAGGPPRTLDGGADAGPAWSPDGSRVAFARYPPVTTPGEPELWLVGSDGSSPHMLTEGQGPTWRSDGNALAFFRRDGIYVAGADGSQLRRLAEGFAPAWSPNGSLVAILLHGVAVVDPVTGGVRQLASTEGRAPLFWSPDSTRIAFSGSQDGMAYVAGLDGSLRKYAPVGAARGVLGWSPDGTELMFVGGDTYRVDGRRVTRPFPLGENVTGIAPDWARVSVSEVAGRFGYPGVDLYVADAVGLKPRLVSPSRCAGFFAHCLEGTDGADTLVGTDRYDGIFGRAGDDQIYGRGGANHLEGSFGRDLLVGGPLNDVIEGQLGNDRLVGGRGIDILDGGPGDDVVDPGPGTDFVGGGPGNDRILAADGWYDGIDCGPGIDTVVADPGDHLELCEHVRVVKGRR
jgi:hypothetical protein